MTEPTAIQLTEFEQIEAAPGTALLRLAARPTDEMRPDERPALVVDDGRRVHRLVALPAPPDPSGLLRVAYSAPTALLGPASYFSLELSNRTLVDLPAPTRRTPRPVVARPAPAPPSHERLYEERRRREEAERRAEEQASRLDELEARLTAAEAERDVLRKVAASVAGEMDEAEVRADARAEVVRRESGRREAAEQELAAARSELAALQTQLDDARAGSGRG